jgi:hypothetical protein
LKSSLLRVLIVGVVCGMLMSPAAFGDTLQASKQAVGYTNTSWALGVVVPEGSGLNGGAQVRWESSTNVTAVFSLPNITLPDRVVYAVLSVMASDGGVMQVAAGAYPNRSAWLTYSWSIQKVGSSSPSYQWILNGSLPSMREGATISMSIFRGESVWNLRVTDEDTGSSVLRPFPSETAPTLMAGDQEVFALESYSRTSATFRTMGNLTLEALLVDGLKVTKGFYFYGDWDPDHNPVFAVGSSGTTPPNFITLIQMGTGSFAWGFSRVWQGQSLDSGGVVVNAVLVGALAAIIVGVALAIRTSRKSAS